MGTAERAGHGAASARAALAGNPSDGYGGAVLAMTLDQFEARAQALPAPALNISPASELVEATVRRFARDHCTAALGTAVRWETTVPRGVGLGGSSAIVIATMRSLCDLYGVALGRTELAILALSIERDDLAIAAGLQDRVAQSFGGLTFMDFGPDGCYEPLDRELLPPLVVAWHEDSSAHSGVVHGDLRARYDGGDSIVVDSMTRLAGLARDARAALEKRDHAAFVACVDATFDVRAQMMELDERHVAMIERARACGGGANYTGSGGAIAAVCRDHSHRAEVTAALREIGCGTVSTGGFSAAANPGA
jgi:glucuronokinase